MIKQMKNVKLVTCEVAPYIERETIKGLREE